MLSTVLNSLLIIDALIIVFLVIVLQQGNEGGIGSAFGGGNSSGFFGASGGVNFIVKATWICGGLFFVLAVGTAWVTTREKYSTGTQIEKLLSTPASVPALQETPVSDVNMEPSENSVPTKDEQSGANAGISAPAAELPTAAESTK